MGDMKRLVRGLSKLEGSDPDYDETPKRAAMQLIRRSIKFNVASTLANGSDAVLANANEGERMMFDGRVLGAYVQPKSGDVTAAGGNNATIAVHKMPGNGDAGTSVASQTTNTSANGGLGSLVNGGWYELTVAAIDTARFTAGQVLAPQVSQNASGVAMPTCTIQVDVELEAPGDDYPI